MTTEKLASVFRLYHAHCVRRGAIPERSTEGTGYAHLAWMCQEAFDNLVPAGRIEKAMRWLGFLQGVLVARGDFTLEQVKNHSRPDESIKEDE